MTLQSSQNDLDGCMILMTDLIVNHHQVVVLAFYGHKLLKGDLIRALLLTNSYRVLSNSSKRDLYLTSVFVVVYIVGFNFSFNVAACHF